MARDDLAATREPETSQPKLHDYALIGDGIVGGDRRCEWSAVALGSGGDVRRVQM